MSSAEVMIPFEALTQPPNLVPSGTSASGLVLGSLQLAQSVGGAMRS